MKYRSIKDFKCSGILLLATLLMATISCKKQIVEVPVDAFAQISPEIEYTQGVYKLIFMLPDYPYHEVGVRFATSKNNLHKNVDLTTQIANQTSLNRYAVYSNSLIKNQIYYYQIYVKDAASGKVVYSDVFSFTTNI